MINMELGMIMEKQYRRFTIFHKHMHMTDQHLICRCWISDEDGANWAFIAPMIAILLVGCYTKHCIFVYD